MGSTMRGEAEMLFGQPTKPVAANKVVQLLFCGLDGRTFPFAHWPEKNWTSWDILSTITEAIEALYENGFTVCELQIVTDVAHAPELLLTINMIWRYSFRSNMSRWMVLRLIDRL